MSPISYQRQSSIEDHWLFTVFNWSDWTAQYIYACKRSWICRGGPVYRETILPFSNLLIIWCWLISLRIWMRQHFISLVFISEGTGKYLHKQSKGRLVVINASTLLKNGDPDVNNIIQMINNLRLNPKERKVIQSQNILVNLFVTYLHFIDAIWWLAITGTERIYSMIYEVLVSCIDWHSCRQSKRWIYH